MLGLALPFGEFGEESLNFPGSKQILLDLTASVYSLTFQQVRGKNEFSQAYPFRNQQIVKRIEVTSDWSPEDLLWVMEQSAQKPIPYDDEIKNNNGWLEAWGALEPGENSLRLVSDPQATGASTILDGTYAWQDYAFQARIVPERGKTFSLIARYQDPEQYAVCRFGTNNRVVLEQFANGTRQELSSGIQRTFQLGQETHLGILVQGQRASCLHEGVAVTGSFLDASLSQGGIGFIAEDTATGTAAMKVEHIYVSANNELP
ncbi:MAG: hypothetical protein HYT50_00900 [Candidatus Wildermuthbacteria bacterium]|nr:hypothetical protein [Candidatus Wildermuthbacteria bacterium]